MTTRAASLGCFSVLGVADDVLKEQKALTHAGINLLRNDQVFSPR